MIKKLFDWTPRDIAYWEKLRQTGMARFVLWYGIAVTGGLFFVILGIITIINWLRQLGGASLSLNQVVFLLVKLLFLAGVALLAGVINSLITWWVEEKLYRKYQGSR